MIVAPALSNSDSAMACPAVVAEYYTYTPLHILQWSQLCFSIASIVVVVYTVFAYLRKSWFEGVFKEAVYSLYFAVLWHDVFTIILQCIQIGSRLFAKTPCDMMFDRWICIFRLIITLAFPSFVCIHAAITIQRVVTTYTGNKRLHKYIARGSLIFILFYCIAYVAVGYNGYPLTGKTCYCSGMVTGAENLLIVGTFIMMFIDVLNVAMTLFLIWRNSKKIREKQSAPLQSKFRYRQTLYSTKQMLPVAFFHLICFSIQFVGFEIGTNLTLPEVQLVTVNGFIYSIPYYCLICPAMLLCLMISEEQRKKRETSQRLKSRDKAEATTNCAIRVAVSSFRTLSTPVGRRESVRNEETAGYFTALSSQWGNSPPAERRRSRRYVHRDNRVASA